MGVARRFFWMTLLALFAMSGVRGVRAEDAVRQALSEYMDTVSVLAAKPLDADARSAFYREWLERFLQVTDANRTSASYADGMVTALSLANGLGDYALAEQLALGILHLRPEWDWQAKWYGELGEVTRAQYWASNRPEDASRAAGYFQQGISLALERKDKLAVDPAMATRFLLSFGMLVGLEDRGGWPEHTAAAEAARQAQAFMDGEGATVKSAAEHVSKMGWDREWLASREMMARLRGDDVQGAYAALEVVSSLPQTRLSPSYYLFELVSTRFPDGGKEFREAVEAWLGSKPADTWTPSLMFRLAGDYFRDADYLAALRVYADLKEDYWQVLLEANAENIAAGRGGYASTVLYNLAQCYLHVDLHALAAPLLEEFIRLFPKDPRAGFAREQLRQAVVIATEQERQLLEDMPLAVGSGAAPADAVGKGLAGGSPAAPAVSQVPESALPVVDVSGRDASSRRWVMPLWVAVGCAVALVLATILRSRGHRSQR